MPTRVKRLARKRRSALQKNLKAAPLRGSSPLGASIAGAADGQRLATAGWAWAHFEAVGWDEV